jgi:hypothetical protein
MSDDEFEELGTSISIACEMVRRNFGEPTVFEHGPCFPGTPVGCGIDHLHIHVVPLPFSLKQAASALFPAIEWKPLLDLSETRCLYGSNIPYALVKGPESGMFWCRPIKDTRQMFRRVIAGMLGVQDQFDYAEFPYSLNALQTLDSFQSITS